VFTKDDKKTATAVNSYAECVAAGNPSLKSYPEQCIADGKTYTNSDAKVTETEPTQKETKKSEESSWFEFKSSTYTVNIPDGWKLVKITDQENLYGRSEDSITYTVGEAASVSTVEGGWDGPSRISLYVPGSYYNQIVRQGSEQSIITTDAGVKAHKYYYVEEKDPEAIGYSKGDKVYNYYFDADGKYIQIEHVVSTGATDQHELVERMIKTLKIN
jgi:hypothetical protein